MGEEERLFRVVEIAYHPDLNSIRNPGGVHEADLSHSCTMDTHVHRCMVERKVAERIRPRVKLNLNSSCHGITERSFDFYSISRGCSSFFLLSLFLFFQPKLQRYSVVPLNHSWRD